MKVKYKLIHLGSNKSITQIQNKGDLRGQHSSMPRFSHELGGFRATAQSPGGRAKARNSLNVISLGGPHGEVDITKPEYGQWRATQNSSRNWDLWPEGEGT